MNYDTSKDETDTDDTAYDTVHQMIQAVSFMVSCTAYFVI